MIKSPNNNIRRFLQVLPKTLQKFSESRNNLLDEPTYYSFSIKFDLYSDHLQNEQGVPYANTDVIPSGLLLDSNQIESASNYLKRINKYKESEALIEFRSITDYLQTERPHFFQSMSGLNEIMKLPEAGKSRRLFEKNLTFNTLESMDNIVSYWMNLYRMSTYDWVNLKYLLPIDKRYFDFQIVVTEFSDLYTIKQKIAETESALNANDDTVQQTLSKDVGASNRVENTNQPNTISTPPTSEEGKNITEQNNTGAVSDKVAYLFESLNENITYYNFEFSKCLFDFDDSFESMAEILNTKAEDQVAHSFVIKPGMVVETQQYGFFDWILSQSGVYGIPPTGRVLQDGMKDYGTISTPYYQNTSPVGNIQTDVNTYINETYDKYHRDTDKYFASVSNQLPLSDLTVTKNKIDNDTAGLGMFESYTKDLTFGERLKKAEKELSDMTFGVVDLDLEKSLRNTVHDILKTDNIYTLTGNINNSAPAHKNFDDAYYTSLRTDNDGKTWKNIYPTEMFKVSDNLQINTIQFKKIEPLSVINEIQRFEMQIKKDITNIILDETNTKDDLDNVQRFETKAKNELDDVQLIEVTPRDTIDPLQLVDTAPRDTIDQLQLVDTAPRDTIDQLDLAKTEPKDTIDTLKLSKSKPIDTISNVELKKANTIDKISDIKLTETKKSDDISDVKLESTKHSTTIDPAKMKFEGTGHSTKIDPKNIYK